MVHRLKILYTIPNFDTAGSGIPLLKISSSLDTNYFEPQIACLHDRGNYVRTETEYMDLLKSSFNKVESFIHDDMLRIPYHHCILLCSEYIF